VPVEIVWSSRALARLREIRDYVANDKPDAAARLATRIVSLVEALTEHPYLGRAGSELGVRELVVAGTPYLIFYKVRGTRVTINTIWHGAQARQRRPRRGGKTT
jgi:toxin ParE1/3/4